MLRRPKPKKLSIEEQQLITTASAQQTGKQAFVKSYDQDYPVFDIPVNQKVLVYIPNHTVLGEDGTVSMRMDKFAAHPCREGRSHYDIRCAAGVMIPSLGLDGSCPLCDAIQRNWDLYNFEYKNLAESRGMSVDAPEAKEGLRSERTQLLDKMAIKKATTWMTFPIVVIECEEKDGQLTTTPKLDAEGKLVGKVMWYSIRENTFNDKWVAGYDSVDTEDGSVPTSPAGLWAILNYTCQSKNGTPSKKDSARALKVTFKTMSEKYNPYAEVFNEMTKDWTPEKARETVVLDALRDMDELKEVTDTLMKPVDDNLQLIAMQKSASATNATSTSDALANFGTSTEAVPSGEAPSLLGEMPNIGVE